MAWEFPGCSVVRTRRFHCWGLGSIPAQGTKIPHAMQHGQEKKNEYGLLLHFINANALKSLRLNLEKL